VANDLIDENTARAIQEVSKATGKGLDLAGKAGSYAAAVFGRSPHNLVGLLVGDWIFHWRIRQAAVLEERTLKFLAERGVKPPFEEVSPSIEMPLLDSALDETRDQLVDLWARLLAAAIDPTRRARVRQSFITTLKQMDPLDAKILEVIYDQFPGGFMGQNGRDALAHRLNISTDEVLVSFLKLERLDCIDFDLNLLKVSPTISAYGKLLLGALR
jgi:hypothetical protein